MARTFHQQEHLRAVHRRRGGRDAGRAPRRRSKSAPDRDKLARTWQERKRIGQLAAEAAKGKGIKPVVFDRGGARYHGKVKALADAAREAGLQF